MVDPVAVSYLLESIGALQVEGRDLTALTVVAEVEHLAYLRYGDQVSQDAFFNAVADAAFDLFASGQGDPVQLVEGLIRGVNERRILMHSFEPDEQAVIDGTTIAGEITDPGTDIPQVGVYLNDGTGAKMSFFLDHEVQVTSASCDERPAVPHGAAAGHLGHAAQRAGPASDRSPASPTVSPTPSGGATRSSWPTSMRLPVA